MARRLLSTSSQVLQYSAGLVTAEPVTMACWIRPITAGSAVVWPTLFNSSTFDSGGTNYFSLRQSGATSIGAYSGSASNATITVGANINSRWFHAAAVIESTTSRSVYFNGGLKNTNTSSRSTPSGIDTFRIGRIGSTYYNGYIAEVALWSAALTDGEIFQLAQIGCRACDIRTSSLVGYWPLRDEAGDMARDCHPWYPGRYNLTATGVATANHPWLVPTPITRRRIWRAFTTAASGISGSLTVTLDAATLSASGTVDVAGTTTASLDSLTVAGTSAVAITGAVASTLGDAATSATAAVAITGSASLSLDNVSLSATGTAAVAGTVGTTLDAMTGSATCTTAVSGSTDTTLDAVTVSATGTVSVAATATATLDAATVIGSGTVELSGAVSTLMDAATLAGTGSVSLTGQAASNLDAATGSASGTVAVSGTLAATLDSSTLSGAGEVTGGGGSFFRYFVLSRRG